MDKPNAIAIPKVPKASPAMAALPHPNRTRTIVPINSEIYLYGGQAYNLMGFSSSLYSKQTIMCLTVNTRPSVWNKCISC